MFSYLCLSVRFLDPAFHGRGDSGKPEWPPSPLRVFQSLLAAAGMSLRMETLPHEVLMAFGWLEQQTAPMVVTPTSVTSLGYSLSVPNNALDIVAKAWCRGNYSNSGDASPAKHHTMKTVRPTRMIGGNGVHYLWPLIDPLTNEVRSHIETLTDIAKNIVALGWGIDMVIGHGEIMLDKDADALPGERWLPDEGATDNGLRVPRKGTLTDLIHRHERFLNRLGPNGLVTPLPPLSVFSIVTYRRATDSPRRSIAAFSLLKLDASGFQAFDTARQALTVAGMTRHAVKTAAVNAGWSESRINAFILGHGNSKDSSEHIAVGPKRFAYLPLPSIEARGKGKARVVGGVRRVILTSFAEESEAEIIFARRAISGQELIDKDKKQPVALLSLLPESDKMVRNYTRSATSWVTVTPVVLPGYDDPAHYRRRLKNVDDVEEQKRLLTHLSDRIDGLLRKAITQAGFSQVLADHAEIEWRKVGYMCGVDFANKYGVPDHLKKFPRYHVRLSWHDAQGNSVQVPGPICFGGGRFYGLGLFVPDKES